MINNQFYTSMKSPLGEIKLTSDGESITGLYFSTHKKHPNFNNLKSEPKLFTKAISQLKEYFEGERFDFDLPLNPYGTDFQKNVWQNLETIPYGQTRSYSQISLLLGKPNSQRAVANANCRNPISIIIPCHRVIAADGNLRGYAGGIENKKWLLEHEKKFK